MQADHAKITRLLKTARGQLDGIARMVEEDRYCIDVFNQVSAAQSLLHRINREILQAHMKHCVRDALGQGNPEADMKIEEITALFDKMKI